MTTVQFVTALINWLLADPIHVSFVAGLAAALTPTPAQGSIAAKLYKVLDIFALNFLHAKETGAVLDPAVAHQVAALLAGLKSQPATLQVPTYPGNTPATIVTNQEQPK